MHASMRCYFERYFPSSRPTEKLCSHPSKHVYWYPWSQRKGPSNAAPRDRSSTWATGSTRWSGRYPCSEPDSLHEKRTVSYISMGLGTPRQHLEFSEFFQGDVPNNWRRFSSSSEWIYGLDLFSAMVWYFRQLTWPTNLSHRTITWCELTIDFQAATHTFVQHQVEEQLDVFSSANVHLESLMRSTQTGSTRSIWCPVPGCQVLPPPGKVAAQNKHGRI